MKEMKIKRKCLIKESLPAFRGPQLKPQDWKVAFCFLVEVDRDNGDKIVYANHKKFFDRQENIFSILWKRNSQLIMSQFIVILQYSTSFNLIFI